MSLPAASPLSLSFSPPHVHSPVVSASQAPSQSLVFDYAGDEEEKVASPVPERDETGFTQLMDEYMGVDRDAPPIPPPPPAARITNAEVLASLRVAVGRIGDLQRQMLALRNQVDHLLAELSPATSQQ